MSRLAVMIVAVWQEQEQEQEQSARLWHTYARPHVKISSVVWPLANGKQREWVSIQVIPLSIIMSNNLLFIYVGGKLVICNNNNASASWTTEWLTSAQWSFHFLIFLFIDFYDVYVDVTLDNWSGSDVWSWEAND